MRIIFLAVAAPLVVADPWNDIQWNIPSGTTNIDSLSAQVSGINFEQGGCLNVASHAVVIHASDGTRVGCGTLGEDIWTTVDIVADQGMASGTVLVPGFAIDNSGMSPQNGNVNLLSDNTAYNAFGHVVVVHNSAGTRVACAETVDEGSSLTFGTYPGYTGDDATGNVTLSSVACVNSAGQCLSMALDMNVSALCDDTTSNGVACGQIHVHSGTTCADAGGHLFRSDVAIMQSYPEYTGIVVASGTARVTNVGMSDDPSINFMANLVNEGGFVANTTGGIHIHTGMAATAGGSACSSAADVGGHMYRMDYVNVTLSENPADDPWNNVFWTTDANGCFNAQIDNQKVPMVEYDNAVPTLGDYNVAGHAAVVHDEFGSTIACGIINHDPWDTVRWASDATGTADYSVTTLAVLSSPVSGFEISTDAEYSGAYINARGHAVVVHDSTGARIGCGCCVGETAMIPIAKYPGLNSSTIMGSVTITDIGDGTVSVEPNLMGLEANSYGGLHIHSGTSCLDADTVGGHLYRNDGAQMGPYPGYDGDKVVLGFIDVKPDTDVTNNDKAIYFSTALVNGAGTAGFPANDVGGVHIHEGTTCAAQSQVGRHFYDRITGLPTDAPFDGAGATSLAVVVAAVAVVAGAAVRA